MKKLIAIVCLFSACKNEVVKTGPLFFGKSGADSVLLFTLTNSEGDTARVTNYGATLTKWITKDKNGLHSSIVLGFDSLQGYLDHPPYFGATVGRYGNRIANGKFTLDSVEYSLALNNGKNHLHGGLKGFDKVVWKVDSSNDHSVSFHYLSKDMEEGYPGNLDVHLRYELTNQDELIITYDASTDKPTVLNLTNHSYFNLTGNGSKDILGHQVKINADGYTPVDSTLIPTGVIAQVNGTPLDFTAFHTIGERIDQVPGGQPGGYDHNYVLHKNGQDLGNVATVKDSTSGRTLEVYTTQPGLQFYSGNFLDGTIKTDDGFPIQKHNGFCMETQHFPNSPNQPNFPTAVLRPGETYHTVTKYKCSVAP